MMKSFMLIMRPVLVGLGGILVALGAWSYFLQLPILFCVGVIAAGIAITLYFVLPKSKREVHNALKGFDDELDSLTRNFSTELNKEWVKRSAIREGHGSTRTQVRELSWVKQPKIQQDKVLQALVTNWRKYVVVAIIVMLGMLFMLGLAQILGSSNFGDADLSRFAVTA